MNRYPVWKYAIIVVALLVGVLVYALPNVFGEAPAVQVSSAKSAVKIDDVHASQGGAGPAPRPASSPRPC
jgi:preprotein translocase subunit SecD